MKTIIINENKSLEIKGIRTKEGGLLIKRLSSLFKKAQTDEDLRYAFNGIIALVDNKNINATTIVTLIPTIITSFYDEFIGLLSDLTGLTLDEIDDLELDKTIEIVLAIAEETDFNKLAGLLKNFNSLLRA